MTQATDTPEPERALERAGRETAARWQTPPAGSRRLDLLRAFARGAGWEVYFDAHGQAVIHTGLYLQHDGEVARIAAPCVENR
jgi:hypothetical protein